MNEDTEKASIENSRKLDRILLLLEGNGPDAPGLMARVAQHDAVLFGVGDKRTGIVDKINTVYRFWVWVLCTLSAGAGGVATALLKKFIHIF